MANSKMLNDAKDFAVSIIEICRVVKERRKEIIDNIYYLLNLKD